MTACAAYAHLYPGRDRDVVEWRHRVSRDQIDIPRYLETASKSGALEVTITVGDETVTYIDNSKTALCLQWASQTKQSLPLVRSEGDVDGSPMVPGWARSRVPMLEQARAWDAEQKKDRKVDVKIVGVR